MVYAKSSGNAGSGMSKFLHQLHHFDLTLIAFIQVDIPTFLGFLMDIESPYEVHDYIKSYVGEEKAQKRWDQNNL